MLLTNFIEIAKNAMNTAAETSRDKGLLENALTMTSFSMPSQADVIEYEITLLTEKQNQIHQHIEELLSEAIERHAELATVCADIASEAKHYQTEYSAAHMSKLYCRRVYGANSHQVETYQAKYRHYCDLYDKVTKELRHAENERDEMQKQIQNMREWLTGATPSDVPTVDDLPFESAVAISAERFQQILETVDVIPAVESYMGRDIDSILSDVNEGFNSAKMCICSAIGSEVWEHEDLTDEEKEAFELALASHFEEVAEHLEEVNAVSQLPSQRRINANIGIRA